MQEDNNSLTIFTRGSQMLAEANTIQKARDLKDLALTAADWARRIGAGEAAIQHARAYAFEAEHKMGEMLAKTDLNKGAKGSVVTTTGRVVVKDDKPTLAELGISYNESSRAQKIAALPQETFDKVKAGVVPVSKVIKQKRKSVPHGSYENWQNFKSKGEQVLYLLDEMKDLRPDVGRIVQAREYIEKIQKKLDSINLN